MFSVIDNRRDQLKYIFILKNCNVLDTDLLMILIIIV